MSEHRINVLNLRQLFTPPPSIAVIGEIIYTNKLEQRHRLPVDKFTAGANYIVDIVHLHLAKKGSNKRVEASITYQITKYSNGK